MMKPVHRTILLATLLLSIVPPATLHGASAEGTEVEYLTVRLGDYRFEPAEWTVPVGDTIKSALVNEDALTPHNLTLEDAAANLNLNLSVVAAEFRFEATGSFIFYCDKKRLFMKSHRERGMAGVLNATATP